MTANGASEDRASVAGAERSVTPSRFRVTWRDQAASYLMDLALLLASRRFRQIVRESVASGVYDAVVTERAPAPTLNPKFFGDPDA